MRGQVLVVEGVWVSDFNDSSRGELANGNMIRVSITSIWPEGDHDIGLDLPQMSDNLRDHLGWRDCIQVSIQVIQEMNAVKTKYTGGCTYLDLTHLAKSL